MTKISSASSHWSQEWSSAAFRPSHSPDQIGLAHQAGNEVVADDGAWAHPGIGVDPGCPLGASGVQVDLGDPIGLPGLSPGELGQNPKAVRKLFALAAPPSSGTPATSSAAFSKLLWVK